MCYNEGIMTKMPFFKASITNEENLTLAVDLDNRNGSAFLNRKEVELKNEFASYLVENGYKATGPGFYKGLLYNIKNNPEFKTQTSAYAALVIYASRALPHSSGEWSYPMLLRTFFEEAQNEEITLDAFIAPMAPGQKYATMVRRLMEFFNLSDTILFYNTDKINSLFDSNYQNETNVLMLNAGQTLEKLIVTQTGHLESGKYSKVFKSSKYKDYLYYAWSTNRAPDVFTKDLSEIIKTGFYNSYKSIAWHMTSLDKRLLSTLEKQDTLTDQEIEYVISAYLRNERTLSDKNMETTALIRSNNNRTVAGILFEQNVESGIDKITSLQALGLSDIAVVNALCTNNTENKIQLALPELGAI